MLPALDFFYQFTNNYGLAIILLTLAIKAAFWSLSAKQYESMDAMKKIQPKIKALQAKHKKEPEKMQKEMMVLYKEHGVNPLGGCLPLLVQLPFMIALFTTLNSNEFLTRTTGKAFFWIQNVSFPETANFTSILAKTSHALYSKVATLSLSGFNSSLIVAGNALPILALLVGLSTYYSQKMMSVEPEQQKMMAFMPVFMVFICFNLNSGVLLYWIVSNVVTAYQQYYMKKQKYVKEEVAVAEIEHIPNQK
ncbi:membrane protein insertase YidC [bacterium]|nr:membrane protein insertase YidC [bacterium]